MIIVASDFRAVIFSFIRGTRHVNTGGGGARVAFDPAFITMAVFFLFPDLFVGCLTLLRLRKVVRELGAFETEVWFSETKIWILLGRSSWVFEAWCLARLA